MADRTPIPSLDPSAPYREFTEETSVQKFKRRLREEPLIPLGCFATCYALYRAYRSMKVKDSIELNRMFRARIYAQFFTLCAVVAGGMYYKTDRQKRREFERMVEERKAQEKRDAWLRELETREREDKGWRERHAAVGESAAKVGDKTTTKTSADENRAVVEEGDTKGESSLGIVDAVRRLVERRN